MSGQYYGWSTPYNYLDAYQMQLDTNVLVNGTCLAANDTYDMVVCPPSFYKLAAVAAAEECAVVVYCFGVSFQLQLVGECFEAAAATSAAGEVIHPLRG